MAQVSGKFVVQTVVKATVCEDCGKLRSFLGQGHRCSLWKHRQRVGGGQVVVIAKHKSVSVTSR
jgi:hypothetical protein